MQILDILRKAIERDASDVFIIAGLPITLKCNNEQVRLGGSILLPHSIDPLIDEIYRMSGREKSRDKTKDDDFSFSVSSLGRFRANVFRQRGSLAAVIRIIRFGIPDPYEIGLNDGIMSFANENRGMVLVAGPAGAGKSTTLACIVDRINRTKAKHIITIEDPIEYIHRHDKSIVAQREVSIDTPGYLESLRSALRESPDVILLGEMRDHETIAAAMKAAETGILMFGTLHTNSPVNTINRVVEAFPPQQQNQTRVRLSQILKGIICQNLIPTVNGGLVPVYEYINFLPDMQGMIRRNETDSIEALTASRKYPGLSNMDEMLLDLFKEGKVTKDSALTFSSGYDKMSEYLK